MRGHAHESHNSQHRLGKKRHLSPVHTAQILARKKLCFSKEIPGKNLLPAECTDIIQKNRRSFEWHERGDVIDYDEHSLVTFNAVAAILLHPWKLLSMCQSHSKHARVSMETGKYTHSRVSRQENTAENHNEKI